MASVVPIGPRGQKLKTFAMYIGGFLGCAVLAPVIWLGVSGLIGLIVAGVIALVTMAAAPWFSLKISNFFMDRFIEEVWESPVLTRRNREIEQQQAIEKDERDVMNLNASVLTFQRKVKGLKIQFPDEAADFADQEQGLLEILAGRYEALQNAKDSLERYKAATVKVQAKWEVALSATAAQRLAGSSAKRNALQQIADDESIKAADAAMDQAFAGLDHMRRLKTDGSVRLEVKPTVKLIQNSEGVFEIPLLRKTAVAV